MPAATEQDGELHGDENEYSIDEGWSLDDDNQSIGQEGLLTAVNDPAGDRHCTACFSGRYPVAVSNAEDWQLALFEKARG